MVGGQKKTFYHKINYRNYNCTKILCCWIFIKIIEKHHFKLVTTLLANSGEKKQYNYFEK